MHETVAARLEALQREYDTGQTMLAELDAKQLDLRQTLLRISGAIQVLQELIADESPAAVRSDRSDRDVCYGQLEGNGTA